MTVIKCKLYWKQGGGGGGLRVWTFFVLLQESEGILRLDMFERVIS